MKFNWLQLVQLLFGAAESIVPVFVHNPQSQKIEAVVVTTVDHVLEGLASAPAVSATPSPAPSPLTQVK